MNLNSIENIGIKKIIDRGSAIILEKNDTGIFVYDTISHAYMLSQDDLNLAKDWLIKHEHRQYNLLNVIGEELIAFVQERYGFKNTLDTYQVAYLKDSIDNISCIAKIETATLDDLPFVLNHYDNLEKWELEKIISMGNLLIARIDGKEIGFIGEHLEGSIGLLFVLDSYRRKKIAMALEIEKIKKTIEQGFIPYGQVVIGNNKSMNLQIKLGFTKSSRHVIWFFND